MLQSMELGQISDQGVVIITHCAQSNIINVEPHRCGDMCACLVDCYSCLDNVGELYGKFFCCDHCRGTLMWAA